MKKFKWKAMLGVALFATTILLNFYWLWGILFIGWVIPDLIRGETTLIETVIRKDTPIQYWIICLFWLSAGLFFFYLEFTTWFYSSNY